MADGLKEINANGLNICLIKDITPFNAKQD
jgi:hypothetical protein